MGGNWSTLFKVRIRIDLVLILAGTDRAAHNLCAVCLAISGVWLKTGDTEKPKNETSGTDHGLLVFHVQNMVDQIRNRLSPDRLQL